MEKLQDQDGYPDKLNIEEIVITDFPNEEIRDWAIDLLAAEGVPWIYFPDETTTSFALAIVATCRPLMETLAITASEEADEEVMKIVFDAHIAFAGLLVRLKYRAIELGIRPQD